MKFKQAYIKDLFVHYSTVLLGAIAAVTLFTTGSIRHNAPQIIHIAAVVTVVALAAGLVSHMENLNY